MESEPGCEPVRERWGRVLAVSGFLALTTAAAVAHGVAGPAAGGAAAVGALQSCLIQGGVAANLLRRRYESIGVWLGAFAFAALVRIVGSAACVLVTLKSAVLNPFPYLCGFGVGYVVLEVVTDVLFVRGERHRDATR